MQPKPIPPELLAQLLSAKVQKRFWVKVEINGENECWPWIGAERGRGPYGAFYFGKPSRAFGAHRLAWVFHHRKSPMDGLDILHSCIARPECCNPNHLREGTDLDNTKDKIEQQRQHRPIGARHHLTHLTERDVLEIRNLYSTGNFRQLEIATLFGVCESTIGAIVTMKSWTHI